MNSIRDLPLDIKLIIASSNEDAWYILWRYDSVFAQHTNTPYYVQLFNSQFTVIIKEHEAIIYTLLKKVHRLDGPAIVFTYSGIIYAADINGHLVRKYRGDTRIISNIFIAWIITDKNNTILKCEIVDPDDVHIKTHVYDLKRIVNCWYQNGTLHSRSNGYIQIIVGTGEYWYGRGQIDHDK